MSTVGWIFVGVVVLYVAVCFGKIAGKHDKNPALFGLLSIISPVNLIILGYWAFSDIEATKSPTIRRDGGSL